MSGDPPDRGSEGERGVASTGAGDPTLAGTFAPGTLISFTYRVEALLARGGMGEVYRTTHTEIGTQHAIKIVRPDLANNEKIMELFRREASVLRTVRDDAIVGYDGVLRDEEGRVYLVMEFVDGPSLTEYLTGGTLTPQEVRDLRDRLARGLAAAHDKGVIHRDMSPDNIILGEGQLAQAKIIDFGIAKLADSSATTIIGDDFAGRYAYASPEQIGLYGGQVDARSDIYSLGLVLATAGTGKALNMGEISESLVSVIEARKRIPDFSSVPESLRNELGAMLQPDPADRPQSMREVIGLDSRLDSQAPSEVPATEEKQQAAATPLSAEPAARPAAAGGGGRGWLWPTVTAGVAAAAVGGYFAWQNLAPPADQPQAVAEVDTAQPESLQPETAAPARDLSETPPETPLEAPGEAAADEPVPAAEAAPEESTPEEPTPEAPTAEEPLVEPPAVVAAGEVDSQATPEPALPSETAEAEAQDPVAAEVPAAPPPSSLEETEPAGAVAQAEEAVEAVVETAEDAAPEVAEEAGETVGAVADAEPVDTQQAAPEQPSPQAQPEEVAEEAVATPAPDNAPQVDDAGDTPLAAAGQENVPAGDQVASMPEAAPEETEPPVADQPAAAASGEEAGEELGGEQVDDTQLAAVPAPSEAELQAAALAAAEAALTRSEKLEIQRDLRALGHYGGGIDGSFGPGTRAGIERYQQVAGLEPTGYLDDAQRADLAAAAQAPRAEEAARLAAEKQAAERRAAERQAAEAEAARAAAERKAAEEAAARARAVAQQRSAPAQTTQPATSLEQALGQQQAALPGESELDRLRRIAEAGDPVAQASLGLRYYRGQGVRKDLEEAYRWTKLAAEQGEARAQSNLGFYYMNGEGIGRDPAQAARWWREAASQGLQQAQFNLGLLYETGRGVSADPQEAAKWYRLASAQGDRQAKSRLEGLVRRGLVSAGE